MNKKFIAVFILTIVCGLFLCGCNKTTNSNIEETTNVSEVTQNEIVESEANQNETEQNEEVIELVDNLNSNNSKESKENEILNVNTITIEVNNRELVIELEGNQATKELVQKLSNGDIKVEASEYGGFEKVGSLGFSLTREDKQINTEAGDLVLYQGNQISLFYNSNSWSYTKLGKVTNISATELKEILGDGDVALTLKI